tara:strand:+ start:285 stop:980 length:696 start_codon:yes stop_codon:yes gene_type:complete
MHQLTSKFKIYLYLFFLICLSSIVNFQLLENYKDKFKIKKINVIGLTYEEKKIVESELNSLLNINIFKLNKNNIFYKLNEINFLENIYVKKIIPSTLKISLSKTFIAGKTIINGEKFYIGNNGKLINSNQLIVTNYLPSVFGNFKINEFLNLQSSLIRHDINLIEIEKYYYYKNKRWDLLFKNGLTLMLPSKDIEKSIIIYKKLLENGKLINSKIIDLRITNQIILTNKNE